jgi:hypothetical protein
MRTSNLIQYTNPGSKLVCIFQLAPVEETIDDMLTRLEEFQSLMHMVSFTSIHCEA